MAPANQPGLDVPPSRANATLTREPCRTDPLDPPEIRKVVPLRQTDSLLPPARQRRYHRLIDEGFQAFNAARLGEACRIYSDKMLASSPRHDDRPDHRRRADAGGPRRLHHRADGARPRRLHHQHRRQPLSRPALRAELHAAPRLAVSRRSRALRAGRHPHLRRAVSGEGAARHRRVHPRVPDRDRPRRPGVDRASCITRWASICAASAPAARSTRSWRARPKYRRADLHLVARRQLDRDERRVSRADARRDADGRPEQRRERESAPSSSTATRTAA